MGEQVDTSRAGTIGVGALTFGLLSLGLCWWFPFGAILGACGVALGLASGLAGGGRLAWLGVLSSAGGASAAMIQIWDLWSHLLGL